MQLMHKMNHAFYIIMNFLIYTEFMQILYRVYAKFMLCMITHIYSGITIYAKLIQILCRIDVDFFGLF
jgi:hypothetical protein